LAKINSFNNLQDKNHNLIKVYFKDDNPYFLRRIDYVLRFIERHPLIQGKIEFVREQAEDIDLKIYYGIEQSDAFYIPSQKVIFSNVLPSFDQVIMNRYDHRLMQLYAIEQKQKKNQTFINGNNFQFDLIETIFFHISRLEEVACRTNQLDQYERMHSKHQILVRYNLHQIPVVDHLVFAFAKAIGLDVKPMTTRFRMTHDIDFIEKKNGLYGQMRTVAAAILKMRDLKRAKRVLQDKTKNPFDTFDWLMLKNTKIEKVIYFLVGGTSKYDSHYDLNATTTQKAFRLAKERGYKIGIHPSYNTWKNLEMMTEEKTKLEKAIGSDIDISRQHYLRFSFKDTPDILEKLGITEDSSIGYGDLIGFRSGTGFPYYLYDFKNEKAYSFLEVPLVFMESAILEETNFKATELEKLWKDFLAKNSENTMITFNFHNSRFYDAALSGIALKELYLKEFT